IRGIARSRASSSQRSVERFSWFFLADLSVQPTPVPRSFCIPTRDSQRLGSRSSLYPLPLSSSLTLGRISTSNHARINGRYLVFQLLLGWVLSLLFTAPRR